MKIAFSTDWFLTIPGILITCGVILLIIALIMFIVGTTKGKKNKEMPKVEESSNVGESQVEAVPTVETVAPVDSVAKESSFINVNTVAEPTLQTEEVTPVAPVIPEVPVIDMPQVAPVVTEVVPPVEIPSVVPPAQEATPVVEIPAINTEVIPTVSEPVVEMSEGTTSETTSAGIYGGSVPTIEASPVQPIEEARPIYGGADPLEATQNLPKMDVHHEPYSGGTQPVENVIPVIPTPIDVTPIPEVAVEKVVDTPVANEQSTAVQTPSVVEIPDVEQL